MSSPVDERQNGDPPSDSERVMREILDARARQLSQATADESLPSEFVEVLKFSVGRNRFAIETRFVTEVLRDIDVTPLPGDSKPLIGLANLRGEVLAVMSLSGVLSLGAEVEADQLGDWIIVLGIDQAMFGIAVTDVTEVIAFGHDQILDSTATATAQSGMLRGVTRDARVVLDGRAVLEDEAFVIDQE